VRELIRNPRVAAVLAASAVVFVGYRVYQGMPGSASALVPAASAAAPDTATGAGSAAGGTSANGAPLVAGFTGIPGGAASRGKSPVQIRPEEPWSWDRNPFLPAGRQDSSPGNLLPGFHDPSSRGSNGAGRLGLQAAFHGTVVSGGQGVAIFGDRIVSEGGTVGEWTVDKVEPYRVVVRRGTESRTLEMFRPSPPGR
jgi:hypothetical protein